MQLPQEVCDLLPSIQSEIVRQMKEYRSEKPVFFKFFVSNPILDSINVRQLMLSAKHFPFTFAKQALRLCKRLTPSWAAKGLTYRQVDLDAEDVLLRKESKMSG